MQQGSDYTSLLSDVIKKQIVILGPDITLAKARNVPGLTVADDGTVTAISGEPQQITQALIDQFVQLSGLIVKKTMEPLLSYRPDQGPVAPTIPVAPIIVPSVTPTPVIASPTPGQQPTPPAAPITAPAPMTSPLPSPTVDQIDPKLQATIDNALKMQNNGNV